MRERSATLRWMLAAVAAVCLAFAIGLFFAAVVDGSPSSWLTVQSNTGRPPRLVALLALGPIALVAIAVLAVKLWRTARGAEPSTQGTDLTSRSSGPPSATAEHDR